MRTDTRPPVAGASRDSGPLVSSAPNAAVGACYRWQGEDLLLHLRVQPRASRAGLGEPIGDALKLRLQSPPVDGAANAELIRLLAKAFGVGRDAITIVTGQSSRNKQVRIAAPMRLPAPIERD